MTKNTRTNCCSLNRDPNQKWETDFKTASMRENGAEHTVNDKTIADLMKAKERSKLLKHNLTKTTIKLGNE
jgi:hypothetical protein